MRVRKEGREGMEERGGREGGKEGRVRKRGEGKKGGGGGGGREEGGGREGDRECRSSSS